MAEQGFTMYTGKDKDVEAGKLVRLSYPFIRNQNLMTLGQLCS